jgi:hypothetical protein
MLPDVRGTLASGSLPLRMRNCHGQALEPQIARSLRITIWRDYCIRLLRRSTSSHYPVYRKIHLQLRVCAERAPSRKVVKGVPHENGHRFFLSVSPKVVKNVAQPLEPTKDNCDARFRAKRFWRRHTSVKLRIVCPSPGNAAREPVDPRLLT